MAGTFGQQARQTSFGFSSAGELADGLTEKTTTPVRPQFGQDGLTLTAGAVALASGWARPGCRDGVAIKHLRMGDARRTPRGV